MIAALFVQTNGCYYGLPDVDPWDKERDARQYAGPHRVVAHPPCERWGRYWWGGPGTTKRFKKGDDGGCFAAALAAVEKWGGVLEHPADSHAWEAFEIDKPPRDGGWMLTREGWTCCVAQGHYGHKSEKMTWLYYVGPRPRGLKWGKKHRVLCPSLTPEQRKKEIRVGVCQRMSGKQRAATPIAFRDLLLSLARTGRTDAPDRVRSEAPEMGSAYSHD